MAPPKVSTQNKNDGDGSCNDKEFKKPETVLPCARCNSMRTKFCYFNNNNPNQPRHYCRDCKRYWTDGGILIDVPVGSARRRNRNKTSCANGDVAGTSRRRSHVFKQLAIPGPAEESGAATASGLEMVLGKSLCPPHNTEEQKNSTDLVGFGDNKDEKSCLSSSSAVVSGSSKNFGSNSAAITSSTQFSTDGAQELVNSGVSRLLLMPPTMPDPGIRAPVVPFPQVPPHWSSIPGLSNGASSVPWARSGGTTSPPVSACSGSDSLALGKHPREEEEEAEKTFLVPKVLRVTDPEEAAKSTIWASLGIEPDERILQSKDGNGKRPESPATCSISYSLAFQKRT